MSAGGGTGDSEAVEAGLEAATDRLEPSSRAVQQRVLRVMLQCIFSTLSPRKVKMDR